MTAVPTTLRETGPADLEAIPRVQREAFGGDTEAALTKALLADATARPALSLLALRGAEAAGHILFTRCRIEGAETAQADCYLLAPLAVVPCCQRQGIGAQLIGQGLDLLRARGAELVFVLGDEAYYPRHGFLPDAGKLGFPPPFPIPPQHAGCWMVRTLSDTRPSRTEGRVLCADTLNRPEYWSE